MRKIVLSLAICFSATSYADIPHVFSAGDVATADAFNQNFRYLENIINNLKAGSSTSSNNDSAVNYLMANVNGKQMQVISNSLLGYYNVTTPTGLMIVVDANGKLLATQQAYFEDKDCQGQGYASAGYLKTEDVQGKPVNYQFPNPRFSMNISVVEIDGEILYTENTGQVFYLNYKSRYLNNQCTNNTGSVVAQKLLPNDSRITGIDSLPLIIGGIGSPITFAGSIGGGNQQQSGKYNVYANGIKIGTTTLQPNGTVAASIISVTLDGYNGTTISLYKDGTYTGGNFSNTNGITAANLYFSTTDCTGSAYIPVLAGANKQWWDYSLLNSKTVLNEGKYYTTLENQVYRASGTSGSVKLSTTGSCTSSISTFDLNSGYQMVAQSGTHHELSRPTFSPPITIEGYLEPTPIDTLPEMR